MARARISNVGRQYRGRGVGREGGIDLEAQECEGAACALADGGAVFADAAGEDDRVEAAECGEHLADAGGQAVDEDVERKLRVRITAGGGLGDLAEIG